MKKIMRKTLDKRSSDEEFIFLWEHIAKRNVLKLICWVIWSLIWIMPWLALSIIVEQADIVISTQIIACIPMTMNFTACMLIMTYFRKQTASFINSIADKLYFKSVTIKGKALVKSDFEVIKEKTPELYYAIYKGLGQGYCYSVSFDLLELLKSGEMVYFAKKCFNKEENGNKLYTMHAIFVKDGWAYDSFGSKQYELTKLLKIYEGKVYKTFSYSDIDGVSYDEFRKREKDSLHAWCEERDCSVSFAKNLE